MGQKDAMDKVYNFETSSVHLIISDHHQSTITEFSGFPPPDKQTVPNSNSIEDPQKPARADAASSLNIVI